jgi:prepilin-type N-terminal cleavage/methylation domain-containing protein
MGYVKVKESNSGFTLIEVMLALLITGILLSVSLRFFVEQWRTSQALKDRIEAHYAVISAGRMVLDAIREAESVQWDSSGILTIFPGEQATELKKYYVAEKTNDGGYNFYQIQNGAHLPVVKGIVSWNCSREDSGLWTITLTGKIGNQIVKWQGSIHQRTTQFLNMVLLLY